jgi:hypothetical protein
MQKMNAGDIYEVGIGFVWILCGVCLFLVVKGYLPRRPDEGKRKVAEEWRRKYGTFAHILWPFGVAMGVYHIISIFLGKR